MPTTEATKTVHLPPHEVFERVADMSHLSEWDPMFDRSERLDDGPIEEGSRFHAEGSAMGLELDLVLTVVTHEPPRRIILEGRGDGIETTEDIEVVPLEDGTACEVTYWSSFETDRSAFLEALSKPAFAVAGRRTMESLQRWLES
jgi:hypothetical protein